MKNLIKLIILFLIIGFAFSCEKDPNDIDLTIEKGALIDTLIIDGNERSYLVYIPQGYDGKEELPLLFLFHGSSQNDSILQIMHFGPIKPSTGMFELADMENFIYVAPKAMRRQNGYLDWNTTRSSNAPADDVSFIGALIDTLNTRYKINNEQIYASGISMGAAFTFALACDLSDRFASIAALIGQMHAPYYADCNPTRPVAVLTINGSLDGTIPYSNAQASMNVWIEHNKTLTTPIIDTINVSINDPQWLEHFLYPDGEQGCVVEHFKVVNAGHDIEEYIGYKDINAFEEFWKFLSQYDINGKIE